MSKNATSPVQTVMNTLQSESMKATGHSWTRLNGVLRGAMHDLIRAGIKFEIDDVVTALSGKNSGYWSDCESWYSSACGGDGGGNTSAAISIENHLGRDPFIWAERTKTPERLCVGSQFTWKNERVTVISFDDKQKTLTACSYTEEKYDGDDDSIGKFAYFLGGDRTIEARTDYENGSIVVRYSAKQERRKIKKRFCISNEEMKTLRSEYDARRRKHEKAIKAATTLAELDLAKEAAAGEGAIAYRHFDLEIIQAAIKARRETITDAMSAEDNENFSANGASGMKPSSPNGWTVPTRGPFSTGPSACG